MANTMIYAQEFVVSYADGSDRIVIMRDTVAWVMWDWSSPGRGELLDAYVQVGDLMHFRATVTREGEDVLRIRDLKTGDTTMFALGRDVIDQLPIGLRARLA